MGRLVAAAAVLLCADGFVTQRRRAIRAHAKSSDGGEAEGAEGAAAELPIDFGSSGTSWRFEWVEPAPTASAWDGRDVVTGATAFVTCHLFATLASAAFLDGEAAAVATRVGGVAAFLLLQASAGASPLVPLRRGLSLGDVGDAFAWDQTIPVAKVSPRTPWPAVAIGASVPVFQAVLVPLVLSAPEGALQFDAARLPAFGDALEKVAVAPLTEGLVFQLWALEACRNAGLPYVPSVLGAAACFGAWHGAQPTSLFLALLGAYWGHLYAQTRNVLVPVSMHALWNALAFLVVAWTATGS